MFHFNQPNIERKNCVWTTKYETIGDLYCPTCRNETCVYISTNDASSFCECKKCKACCHVLKIHLRTKNRKLCCLVMMVYIALQKKTSRDYEKEKQFPFLLKYLRQSQSSTPEPEPKKAKILPFMVVESVEPVCLLPDKQLFINVPFQSTKYRKKELCVDNKVRDYWRFVLSNM